MPYKSKADRKAASRRWRKLNPEKDASSRQRATAKQTAKRQNALVNPTTQKAREHKAILVEYKGGHCVDCGGIFPACCYDFDHLRDKAFEIGWSMGRRIEVLKAEADKCDLVCSNCHRIRTQKRANVGGA
jgi:hypothetical protein